MDAGRLDPQQVFEWQRIAPLLQRQHDFADAEVFDIAGKIVDRVAVDCFLDHRRAVAHADEADDDEARLHPFAQLAQPLRTVARAQHQNAPAEDGGAQQSAEQDADEHQQRHRDEHRVEQVGPPQGAARQHEIDDRKRDDAEADRHQQPRSGIAHRAQRIRAIDPDRNHRGLYEARKDQQRHPAIGHLAAVNTDLVRPHRPAKFARRQQQDKIEQCQQEHRVRNVEFEQADHGAAIIRLCGPVRTFSPRSRPRGVKRR